MSRGRTSKADPILLYSASTYLAYSIAEKYYGRMHFAWCSPLYDVRVLHHAAAPPSSNPCEIIAAYAAEVARGDRHGQKIKENRNGIATGARVKFEAGLINRVERGEIEYLADGAELAMFRPVLFVIPYAKVKRRVERMAIKDWANPLWTEYRIEQLPASYFHTLDI